LYVTSVFFYTFDTEYFADLLNLTI
jgi:hypothetical protein